MYTVNRWVRR